MDKTTKLDPFPYAAATAEVLELRAENERLRAVLFKIADDSAHADQYVQWAQDALGRDKCRYV